MTKDSALKGRYTVLYRFLEDAQDDTQRRAQLWKILTVPQLEDACLRALVFSGEPIEERLDTWDKLSATHVDLFPTRDEVTAMASEERPDIWTVGPGNYGDGLYKDEVSNAMLVIMAMTQAEIRRKVSQKVNGKSKPQTDMWASP